MELTTIFLAAIAAAMGGALSYLKGVYIDIVKNGHFLKKFWSEVSVSSLAGVAVSLLVAEDWGTPQTLSLLFLIGFAASRSVQELREKITGYIEDAISEKLKGEKGNEP